MGGLVCSACNPPRTDADCVLRLVICGGLWDDADNPFDGSTSGQPNESPGREEAADRPAATETPPKNGETKFDGTTISELAAPLPSQRMSRRAGEPLLDLELDFFFNLPTGGWPEVVTAEDYEKISKKEDEETGPLELGVQKSGYVGGFVRRGEGIGLSVDPPHNNERAKTQFAVGQVVRLLRRLETFRGAMRPGDGYVVSSIGVDSHGETVLSISRDGSVWVSGLVPDSATIATVGGPVSVGDLIG